MLHRAPLDPDAAQREQLGAWESALAGSGLPVVGLDAERPRPRFAVAAPLAAAIPGERELVDVWLAERLPVWRVREALLLRMPPGWTLVELFDVWLGEPALPGRVVASVYRAELSPASVDASALEAAATALLAADALPRERRKGDARIAYDLRPFIGAIEITGASGSPRPPGSPGRVAVRMTLRHDPEKGVGRPEEVLAALAEAMGGEPLAAAVVRERLVLSEPPPPSAPAPRRRPGTRPAPQAR